MTYDYWKSTDMANDSEDSRALFCKNEQPLCRADGGCLECEADAGESCRQPKTE